MQTNGSCRPLAAERVDDAIIGQPLTLEVILSTPGFVKYCEDVWMIERPFSEFLRQPDQVIADLAEHDVHQRAASEVGIGGLYARRS